MSGLQSPLLEPIQSCERAGNATKEVASNYYLNIKKTRRDLNEGALALAVPYICLFIASEHACTGDVDYKYVMQRLEMRNDREFWHTLGLVDDMLIAASEAARRSPTPFHYSPLLAFNTPCEYCTDNNLKCFMVPRVPGKRNSTKCRTCYINHRKECPAFVEKNESGDNDSTWVPTTKATIKSRLERIERRDGKIQKQKQRPKPSAPARPPSHSTQSIQVQRQSVSPKISKRPLPPTPAASSSVAVSHRQPERRASGSQSTPPSPIASPSRKAMLKSLQWPTESTNIERPVASERNRPSGSSSSASKPSTPVAGPSSHAQGSSHRHASTSDTGVSSPSTATPFVTAQNSSKKEGKPEALGTASQASSSQSSSSTIQPSMRPSARPSPRSTSPSPSKVKSERRVSGSNPPSRRSSTDIPSVPTPQSRRRFETPQLSFDGSERRAESAFDIPKTLAPLYAESVPSAAPRSGSASSRASPLASGTNSAREGSISSQQGAKRPSEGTPDPRRKRPRISIISDPAGSTSRSSPKPPVVFGRSRESSTSTPLSRFTPPQSRKSTPTPGASASRPSTPAPVPLNDVPMLSRGPPAAPPVTPAAEERSSRMASRLPTPISPPTRQISLPSRDAASPSLPAHVKEQHTSFTSRESTLQPSVPSSPTPLPKVLPANPAPLRYSPAVSPPPDVPAVDAPPPDLTEAVPMDEDQDIDDFLATVGSPPSPVDVPDPGPPMSPSVSPVSAAPPAQVPVPDNQPAPLPIFATLPAPGPTFSVISPVPPAPASIPASASASAPAPFPAGSVSAPGGGSSYTKFFSLVYHKAQEIVEHCKEIDITALPVVLAFAISDMETRLGKVDTMQARASATDAGSCKKLRSVQQMLVDAGRKVVREMQRINADEGMEDVVLETMVEELEQRLRTMPQV